MRIVRGIGGVLLWIVASLLAVVAVVLCVTVILLPVGVPLLLLCRRLFAIAMKLLLPREVAHPLEEVGKSVRRQRRKVAKSTPDMSPGDVARSARKNLRGRRRRTGKWLPG